MPRAEQSIEVGVGVTTAYNQWTQLEQLPAFVAGVEEVHQLDDTHLRVLSDVAGERAAWDAEIVEQRPDRVIAWRSSGLPSAAGRVSFEPTGDRSTRIHVELELDEARADAAALSERLRSDLERFKALIERRGHESGAWRGEVHAAETTPGSTGTQVSSEDQATSGDTPRGPLNPWMGSRTDASGTPGSGAEGTGSTTREPPRAP